MSSLVLLAGVPGAGKSTWAKTLFDLKYKIVSSDAIRKRLAGSLREAHDEQVSPWEVFYGEIESALLHQIDVVADATFLTRRHRDRAREVAEKTGAVLHLVVFKNWWVAHARNEERESDTQVPRNVMADMMKLYWDMLAEIVQEEYDSVTKIEAFACHPTPTPN